MENHNAVINLLYNRYFSITGSFSIAMLNYRRITVNFDPNSSWNNQSDKVIKSPPPAAAPSAPTAKNPGNGWLAGRDWNPGALRRKNHIQRLTQKRNRFLFCLAVYIYIYTIVYIQCVYIINKRNTSTYVYSNILEWGRGKETEANIASAFQTSSHIVPLFHIRH